MTIHRIARSLSTLVLTLALFACGGGGGAGEVSSGDSGSGDAPTDPTPPVTTPVTSGSGQIALTTGDYVVSALSAHSVGPAGGTLSVTGANDPLAGASLSVPAGVLTEAVNVVFSSALVASVTGLPEGASVRGRSVRVQLTNAATGAAVGALADLVRITLPVDTGTTDSIAYYQVENDGMLEAMGHESIDPTTGAVTFATRAASATGTVAATVAATGSNDRARALDTTPTAASLYANYLAVGLSQIQLARMATTAAVLDTGFRPSVNGFSIPNMGSFYIDSRSGNCFGMVGFAKYYYQMGFVSKLADTYRDAQKTATWVDDSTAIELASRVHGQMKHIWSTYDAMEVERQTSASGVERSLIGALYVTGRPALMYVSRLVGQTYSGSHAVAVYSAAIATNGSVDFAVYDPNMQKNDSRRIHWSSSQGFDLYQSGSNAAAAGVQYNFFRHMGFSVGLTPEELARDKSDADAAYPASLFPTITITSITGRALADNVLANTGTTPDGLPEYKTADSAIVVEGTVLGGNAQVAGQVVNTLNIITPDAGLIVATIDNSAGGGTGKFKVVIPIKSGISTLAFLASDPNSYSHWAAFKQVLVESTAAPSYFTATLTWNQGTSDIDLYVKEPDGAAGTADAGKVGDIVFFSHREGVSTTKAYLDFDNTDGYGPENYLIKPGLKTGFTDGTSALSANGSFTLAVHYFGWNGDDSVADRSVPWTVKWRLLKSCNNACANPETDGLWLTGTQTGTLTQDDDQQAGADGFATGGSAWSSKFQIPFPAATASWTVPPSNTVMLP